MKELLVPVIKKDILEKRFYELISSTSNSLSKTYKIQASVREINFFKLSNQKRDRIIQKSSLEDIINNSNDSKSKDNNFWRISDKSNSDQLKAVIGICFMFGTLIFISTDFR